MLRRWILFFIIITAVMVLFSGCTTQVSMETESFPTDTNVPPSKTPVPPTDTPIPPTATQTSTQIATNTPTQTSTDTAIPTSTATETLTPTATRNASSSSFTGQSVDNAIRIYFISPNAGGPVACGDYVIGLGIGEPRTSDVSEGIEKGLKSLLSYKSEWVGGLYNPLGRSSIKVESVRFSNGLATVNLRGTYAKPDDDCDNLRVKAQVWTTVRQFRGVRATNIYLNGIPFGDRVSNDK